MKRRTTATPSMRRKFLRHAPIAAAIISALPRAHAQEDTSAQLQEVTVTAQKRTENLQTVPLSITALDTQDLEDLRVTHFDDYMKFLPSVNFQSTAGGGGASGPGFERVFMRGVSAGDNANHSGPLPTVGVYLDEQPITTIEGALDLHIYDVQRVEALAGPQGTLYGASSEAGTVRIITNKPDPHAFSAGYDLQGDATRGQAGYVAEGFVNVPLSENAAVRLVGWSERDAPYIDNVPGHFTYPTADLCLANTKPAPAGCVSSPTLAEQRFNPVQTNGARAALKVDLDEHWTVSPSLIAQKTDAHGLFAEDPALGDLEVSRYYPDTLSDKWWQAALTVEGKFAIFDVTYAGAFLHRDDRTSADYTDYSYFYDTQYGSGAAFAEPPYGSGPYYDSSQYILGVDGYRNTSHELRFTSPQDKPLRFIGGLFYERQQHNILQNYQVNDLPIDRSVPGWPHAIWLTDQVRVDRDEAVFGELSYDIVKPLTATVGWRLFHYQNSIEGFYGYGPNNIFGSSTGTCLGPSTVKGAPCDDVNNSVSRTNSTPKYNLEYKIDDAHMVYATFSRGFRPGGINRRTQPAPLPPLATYGPDFLNNYEAGWKTSWFGNSLRFNGAVFVEDWKNFQFSFLGQNSFTIVRNAGAARIKGVETSIEWLPFKGLLVSAGGTYLDARMTQDFCVTTDDNGLPLPLADCPKENQVPSGTRLPSTPRFKGNLTSRYTFEVAGLAAHIQGALEYQSDSTPALPPAWTQLIGMQRAFAVTDLSAGVEFSNLNLEFFVDNAFDRRAQTARYSECAAYSPFEAGTPDAVGTTLCGVHPYAVVNTPRTMGIRFGQKF